MKILLAITGASGSVYGLRLAEELLRSGIRLSLTASKSGIDVCLHETGIKLDEDATDIPVKYWKLADSSFVFRKYDDLYAPEASGSAAPDAMIVAPCSMGTVARIAAGVSGNLIERAADVMIKEGKPLLLVPRETPFSAIHLENMLKLARIGVKIIPAMPAFYHKPETMEELTGFVVGKIMDQLGIRHNLFKRWQSAD